MRVPWGLLTLALVVADVYSLWLVYGVARGAGYGVVLSFLTVGAYVVLAFMIGVSVLVSGPVNAMRRAFKGGVDPQGVGRRMLDGVLVAVAAGLLMAPGVASDALAVLLLFPLTRPLFRPLVKRGAVVSGDGSRVTLGYARNWGAAPRREERAGEQPRARVTDEPTMDVDRDEYRVE